MDDRTRYLSLLSEKYPTSRALSREIINLSAILNLPKGTEHFMSDIHGEYEAFCHILNNCSGVIREKVDLLYGDILSDSQKSEICTLVYYPKEKLALLKSQKTVNGEWYEITIHRLTEIARLLSSKYTRSKVRKALPADYAYIIDELLHAQKDEDDNQILYHQKILDTIIKLDPDDFIISFSSLIKRLAVDRLHIVGDIFDRGARAERVLDLLTRHHSLDIEWGNHDILYMGAACGNEACICNVVKNAIKYHTVNTLESGYGISLRNFTLFAEKTYREKDPMKAALKAITVMTFKCEGALIQSHPEYEMDKRLILHSINKENRTAVCEGVTYPINEDDFPTLCPENPYELTGEEKQALYSLVSAFLGSEKLREHIAFLYEKGGMYRIYNSNLLYHGCVPLKDDGSFDTVDVLGEKFSGKKLFDRCDAVARDAFFKTSGNHREIDFMWYLWCGEKSPLCGRNIKTFERAYVDDKTAWTEEKNPYYRFYYEKEICETILSEFGLSPEHSHIINGHTPVRTAKGELPVRAESKLFVIDGGFCEKYHETTGIAGYTLISNSHGLRLKAHRPFESVGKAIAQDRDIRSDSSIVETERRRVMVGDTDDGRKIRQDIDDLYDLLYCYRS
ncbi:MAG: fructose-1,6-bisphosphatase [Ruminococcus sp.]|nr:fructose-1,6-bisphosphatase [Ruminococcus sp.]